MSDVATEFPLTPAERELLPTRADIDFYAEHGWYLSRQLLTHAEVDRLVSASEEYYAGSRDRRLPHHPARLSYWTPEEGDRQRHNDYIHFESQAIASILRKPLIGAVAALLAGADEIRVFQSTLIYKPARSDEPSNIVPWHFDRDYWATSTSERMLTAFIPLHDCDESRGTICMVDGSHRWREAADGSITSLHFADRGAALNAVLEENARANGAEIRKVPMVIPKGHMSFHHCRTYHGSGPNVHEEPRRGISLHLQDGENVYREFVLPDGSAAAYNHDTLVRMTSEGRPDYADPEFCPTLWKGPHENLR